MSIGHDVALEEGPAYSTPGRGSRRPRCIPLGVLEGIIQPSRDKLHCGRTALAVVELLHRLYEQATVRAAHHQGELRCCIVPLCLKGTRPEDLSQLDVLAEGTLLSRRLI